MPEDIQCIQYVYTEYKYVDMSQVLFISGKHSCKHQKCLYVDGYKYLHRKGVYRYPTPLSNSPVQYWYKLFGKEEELHRSLSVCTFAF